ncbi:hypothetical protein F2Q69_00032435 [Brassica cretica]|uniref:Uncharacterized protein n=1 Tax=Brassica cretica TaxID=69181 RepID=A0A8S9S161_BRACR|nr:hypothetical protein F2Q69_00032435 [Brassica cretica]
MGNRKRLVFIKSPFAYTLRRRRMDPPSSLPHYQNPNPNFFQQHPPLHSNPSFFHRTRPPPLLTPNTYSIPPSPPPTRELSGTISSLQSLLSECQRTLDSLSQNLSLDHSSPLHKDATETRSSYLVSQSLTTAMVISNFGNNFFYNDCLGAVNFSELDGKTRSFTLPSVLSVECSEFEASFISLRSKEHLYFLKSSISLNLPETDVNFSELHFEFKISGKNVKDFAVQLLEDPDVHDEVRMHGDVELVPSHVPDSAGARVRHVYSFKRQRLE